MKKLDCRDTRAFLNAHLDGVLERASADAVDAHLASCPECRRELDALRGTRSLLADAGAARAPEAWVHEAIRNARRSAPDRAGRRLSFLTLPATLSTVAAAALLVIFFATGRLQIRTDVETPASQAPRATLTKEPAPAPHATRANEPPPAAPEPGMDDRATIPGSPVPPTRSVRPPSSDPPAGTRVAAKPDAKDAVRPGLAAPDRTRDEKQIAANETAGGKEVTSAAEALHAEAPGESAGVAPDRPSYRVTLAQIHFPEPKRLNREDVVTSFSAPSPTLDKTEKNEPASLRQSAAAPQSLIRAVAVVDGTGRILSARPVTEDVDRRTRDFLARLVGARVDLPARPENEGEDRPARTAAPSGTPAPSAPTAPSGSPASTRTSEILLEIVLGPSYP